VKISWNSKALIVTLLFRLLFGGYVVGMDQFLFNDNESALTVLLIYVLMAIFVTLFILGKRYGLISLIALETIFIVLNSVFLILTLGQITDAGMHNPLDNWWTTLLRFSFSILTLVLSFRTYRETKKGNFEI